MEWCTITSKLRRFLHHLAAGLLHYSGALRLWRFFRQKILRKNEVCVLGVHRVLREEEKNRSNSLDSIILREATFVKALEYITRRFYVVSLDTFLESETRDIRLSRPLCLLTFDDGWRDSYTVAYPWLKKFGLPATMFITTGFVGAQVSFWVEQVVGVWRSSSPRERTRSLLTAIIPEQGQATRLEEIIEYLKHMPAEKRQCILQQLVPMQEERNRHDEVDQTLTWDQVIEMSHEGIDFGAHTVTHPLLTYEDDMTVERELRVAKQTLEEKVGKKVRVFAYPNGDWDDRVRQWVEQTGYECAFTTRQGWYRSGQDRYTVRRIMLHEGNVTGRHGQFSPAMFNLTLAAWG